MPKAFPSEFRRDVVAVARRKQAPMSQIARDFGISEVATVPKRNVPVPFFVMSNAPETAWFIVTTPVPLPLNVIGPPN